MRCFFVAFLIAVTGCASDPLVPATPSAPSAVAPAAPVPLASTDKPAIPATAGADSEGKFEPPPGYKARQEGGRTIYCTKVTVLGSRFPKDDCRTQEDLEEMAFASKRMRGEMDMRRSQCTSFAGCSSM